MRRRSRPAIPSRAAIGFGEVLADITERGGPEQGVGERVTHRVAVRMPTEAVDTVEPDATEHQRSPLAARMDVEPDPDARRSAIPAPHPSFGLREIEERR